jgi:hypothetical protein
MAVAARGAFLVLPFALCLLPFVLALVLALVCGSFAARTPDPRATGRATGASLYLPFLIEPLPSV